MNHTYLGKRNWFKVSATPEDEWPTHSPASLPQAAAGEKKKDKNREGQHADGPLKTRPTQEVTDSSMQAGHDPSAPS